ncbi:MAG: hypothetical protein JSV80_17800 [Acidobacteriota bacterium]|nr:MAG: hypothetical protein JSV80_17800 [Acidobacteriota bacterium]
MCRLAGYRGPSVPLATLIYDPPHGLEHQSYKPREMISGSVSVDGTGIVWWVEGDSTPLRYVSERPPWSDANLPRLASRLGGCQQLAAVRSATPGTAFGPRAVLPFTHTGVAGALNGYLGRFREQTGPALVARLPAKLFAALDSGSDASVAFLTVMRHREQGSAEDSGDSLRRALREAVAEIFAVCSEAGAPASLTMLLAEADRILAVRAASGAPPNSLYVAQDAQRWPSALLIASEPLDDDTAWQAVPADHLVETSRMGWHMEPL